MEIENSVQVKKLARHNIAKILCVDSYDSVMGLSEEELFMTTSKAKNRRGLKMKATLSSIVSKKSQRIAPVRGNIILMLKNDNKSKGKK